MDRSLLRRLAGEVEEEHRDTMACLVDSFARDVLATDPAVVASRRSFLRNLGMGTAVGGALVFVPVGRAAAADAPKGPNDSDLEFLAWAQSLETAAVAAYDIALGSARLDADVGKIARMFRDHHRDHAAAVGAAAGRPGAGIANASIVAKLGPSFRNATSQSELLTAAFNLENAAASTYLTALGKLSGSDPAATVASILPTEARHAVVLGAALGLDLPRYVPAGEPESNALVPRDYPIGG